MRELFIYWRTAAATVAAAESAAQAWQRQLQVAHPGLRAALYRRAEEPGAAVTLMEVYAADAGLFDAARLGAALEQRIVSEGDAVLGRWVEGRRMVEAFVRCAGPSSTSRHPPPSHP